MGALAGFRVLEIGEGATPSIVGMLLAEHGAEVVKIESPGGDRMRADPGFAVWNRGKRSAVVDRARAQDRSALAARIGGADACILGPGECLDDWGDEVAEAARCNQALILLRLPAYLAQGAPWAGGRESHGLLTAAGGLGWRQSSNDGGPVDPISKFVSYIQAAWAAACLCAALYERGEDGHGQEVTVTGLNGLMAALPHPYSVDPHLSDAPTDIGSFGRHPTYRPYQGSDGKWVGSGALGVKFETQLLEIIGRLDILRDPRIAGNFDRMKDPANVEWVMDAVAEAFRKRPRDEWIDLLMAAGIPCGPVNPREELLDQPQVVAIDMRAEIDDPERGRVVMPGIPIVLEDSPGRIAGPAPMLGTDGSERWPLRALPSGPRRYRAGPLSGVQILNLGTFVAMPYAGFLLSELGADVIKVERPEGDPFRINGYPHNRGMRGLAIDLAAPAGIAAFKRLSRSADIVMEGMRPGVMRKLELDHEQLARENPDIVTLSLSGFGETGPLAPLPGFDMVMQGFSGMMIAQGDMTEPVAHSVAYVDVATACINAFACTLGLLHRQRSGRGQHIWTSLLGTAAYLQLAELTRYPDRPAPRQGKPDFRGASWFDRYYATSDGWVRIDASSDVSAARAVLARLGFTGTDDAALEAVLAGGLQSMNVDAATRWLNDADIPAVRTRRISELFADPDLIASEFAHFGRSVEGTTMSMPGRYASFSRTQRWGPMRPPGVGEHSRQLLAEAGFPEAEVDDLITGRVIRQGSPMPSRFAPTYR